MATYSQGSLTGPSERNCGRPDQADRVEKTVQESYSVNDVLRGKGPKVNEHHEGRHNTYMAHKIVKLGDQNLAVAGSVVSGIFNGCVVFVNGYTDPPVNELKRLIAVNGGRFNQYEIPNTTHFVCNHFPQTKLDRLKKGLEKRKLFYVTVKWVINSVARGQRLPEADYRPPGLYDFSTPKLSAALDAYVSCERALVGTKRKYGTEDASLDAMKAMDVLESLGSAGHHKTSDGTEQTVSSSRKQYEHPKISDTSHPRNAENDPNFIEHFFESSRLHFIGTWRSRLPSLFEECMSAAPSSSDHTLPVKDTAVTDCHEGSPRVVLHIDMDCFFVSVLLRSR